MNRQPIEKRIRVTSHLSVHSIFRTIQGEGPFAGTPSVFIRLAGCNLQCPLCDTDYTTGRRDVTPQELLEDVQRMQPGGGLVVITGGEPFRQELEPLLSRLCGQGYYVQIETNGTLPPAAVPYTKETYRRSGVYIVCSPKTGKVNTLIEKLACCYKYVLGYDIDPDDGLPTQVLDHSVKDRVARPPKGFRGVIYLQPADYRDARSNSEVRNLTLSSCLTHGYVLQLQIHKILGVE